RIAMSLRVRSLLILGALAAVGACSSDSNSRQLGVITSPDASRGNGDFGGGRRFAHTRVCVAAVVGEARCHSYIRVDDAAQPRATVAPGGYGPADLRAAYGLGAASSSGGIGHTIAIVDAFDDPNAERDLGVYRSTFGLPACTTANGCFRK